MEFHCPICNSVLNQYDGERVHPGNPAFGITLDCGNKACPAPEVMGHGDNANRAFFAIMEKYARKLNKPNETVQ